MLRVGIVVMEECGGVVKIVLSDGGLDNLFLAMTFLIRTIAIAAAMTHNRTTRTRDELANPTTVKIIINY